MGSKTESVGRASDVQFISSPYTQQFMSGAQQLAQQGLATMQGMQPGTALLEAVGAMPQFQQLTAGLMGPYAGGVNSVAMLEADRAARNIAGQYSGANALYSGAAQQNIYAGAADVLGRYGLGLGQMQANLGGGILDQYFAAQGQQRGLSGQLAMSGYGLMAPQAAGEWWQPAYVQRPGAGQMLLGALTGLGGAAVGGMFGAGGMFGKST